MSDYEVKTVQADTSCRRRDGDAKEKEAAIRLHRESGTASLLYAAVLRVSFATTLSTVHHYPDNCVRTKEPNHRNKRIPM
jgi:hypothetical protein